MEMGKIDKKTKTKLKLEIVPCDPYYIYHPYT